MEVLAVFDETKAQVTAEGIARLIREEKCTPQMVVDTLRAWYNMGVRSMVRNDKDIRRVVAGSPITPLSPERELTFAQRIEELERHHEDWPL
jgi:hypothetical protein